MSYEIFRHPVYGLRARDIDQNKTFGPEHNEEWKAFLEWNAAQPAPFDVRYQGPELPTTAERRKAEYEKQGITLEALTVALWEKLVEGRSETADALQAKRTAIKDQFPAQAAQTVKG